MSEFSTIQFSIDEQVARITLNRPDAANSINIPMSRDLLNASIECRENADIRAIVLTGNGKMFCAGGDLASFADLGDRLPAALREITANVHAAIANFQRGNAPLITAINGAAAGAGFSLAIAGDFALAAASARFTMAYTAAGLAPDGGSSWFLPRLIGHRRALELAVTNRRLDADEALQWGLVNRVVADNELTDETDALASQLAAGATQAFGTTKRLFLQSFDSSLETQLQRESDGIAAMGASADGREGIDAFHNKRKPEFRGR